jgi:hypothetical protein
MIYTTYTNEEVKEMMQRDCGSCGHNKDGLCTNFGDAIEDAYLVDCPCRVEASTITTETIEKMTRLAKGSTSWFAEIRGE